MSRRNDVVRIFIEISLIALFIVQLPTEMTFTQRQSMGRVYRRFVQNFCMENLRWVAIS